MGLGSLKIGIAVLATLAFLGGGAYLRLERIAEREAIPPPVQHPWALHTVKVRQGTVTEGFPVLATLSSSDEISIKPQIGGVIHKIGPREGKRVEKGMLLALVDTVELKTELAALRASLTAAAAEEKLQRIQLKRIEKLVPLGFATPEKRDQLIAAVEVASGKRKQLLAQIAEVETRIGYGVIRSPVNGQVVARNQTIGDLASPGKEIYRINAASGAKVKIVVPQEILAGLHAGSDVVLTYAGKSKTVRLTRLYPALDALSMGTAEADLEHAPFSLPSGARVAARVITRSYPEVTILPLSAVARSADGRRGTVFKVENSASGDVARLKKIAVDIEARGFEGLAVKGDIARGDAVVTAHESVLLRLQDADPVLPVPEEPGEQAKRKET